MGRACNTVNPFSATAILSIDPAYAVIFQDFTGTLDAGGNATATCNVPNLPSLSGFVAHLAFATIDPAVLPAINVSEVSNGQTVTLQ